MDLYRIEKDAFCNTLRITALWNDLINKSTHFVKVCHKGLKLMERSNRQILDNLSTKIEMVKSKQPS